MQTENFKRNEVQFILFHITHDGLVDFGGLEVLEDRVQAGEQAGVHFDLHLEGETVGEGDVLFEEFEVKELLGGHLVVAEQPVVPDFYQEGLDAGELEDLGEAQAGEQDHWD